MEVRRPRSQFVPSTMGSGSCNWHRACEVQELAKGSFYPLWHLTNILAQYFYVPFFFLYFNFIYIAVLDDESVLKWFRGSVNLFFILLFPFYSDYAKPISLLSSLVMFSSASWILFETLCCVFHFGYSYWLNFRFSIFFKMPLSVSSI